MSERIREMLQRQAPLWPLAMARILIGLLWLGTLRWKLPPDFVPSSGRGLMDWLELEVQYPALAFYGDFVSTIVIPNFRLFAWIIFLGELAIGLMLLLGFWTRLAGVLGLLMSINLGIGLLEVPGEWPWSYMMMAMWHAVFVVVGAGRVLGADAWLRSKYSTAGILTRFT
jgi:uncharacterized membrane protein YphA (DoxX/SURF4 family)